MNLLIPYVHLYNHPDPAFGEFTYGDIGARARKLQDDLQRGGYVFFHTSIRARKYITAYYVTDRVLSTAQAAQDRNIVAKFRNPHILECLTGARHSDDAVLFGDPLTSRVLDKPLPFDISLAEKLSLNIRFAKGKTETQAIGSATRAWRRLTEADVTVILDAIMVFEQMGVGLDAVLSTDEVKQVIEKDLEGYIERSPGLVGESLQITRRQLDTPVGRIDLLLEDEHSNIIVVELKLETIGRDAVAQVRKYMDWLKKQTDKRVSGIIVCKDVMPAFEEDLKKLKDIRIFRYGWQFRVYPWE